MTDSFTANEPPPLLALRQLSIAFGGRQVVSDLNLSVQRGERVALVGESGSGKTVTALSILRLLAGAKVQGEIRFNGCDLNQATVDELRQVRGRDIAMIFQEPMTALNPLFTIGQQVMETLSLHDGLLGRAARERAVQLLTRTGIRDPARRVDSYPHQLSGGQRQRAMIAMALACKPQLLIADEPTTALDPSIRARIVQLLLDLQAGERTPLAADAHRTAAPGMAVLLITHDLNLVRRFAQRVAVMERGRLVEVADTETLFRSPQHPYTRQLLDSLPERSLDAVAPNAPEVLRTHGLRVEYSQARPGWRGVLGRGRFVALESADTHLREGETIGVVGESGSGKSTLAQAILSLVRLRAGRIDFEGQDVRARGSRERRALRARLQVVFQDPYGALSPRHTVEQIVGEGLALHQPHWNAAERRQQVVDVLGEVGLPATVLHAYPHQFSGGQRQRIAIARALVLNPRVLVLDEPTSALDVSIQKQVLDLLVRLQKKFRLSYVLISHDLAVVRAMAHRLYVLRDGAIVETGPTEAVIAQPQHAYTQRWVQASL
ncbi:MAG: dipeptide ABC transporter ATP-binding protein [Pseudomonadota bacterium]